MSEPPVRTVMKLGVWYVKRHPQAETTTWFWPSYAASRHMNGTAVAVDDATGEVYKASSMNVSLVSIRHRWNVWTAARRAPPEPVVRRVEEALRACVRHEDCALHLGVGRECYRTRQRDRRDRSRRPRRRP